MAEQDTLTEYCSLVKRRVYLIGFIPSRTETALHSNFGCLYSREGHEGELLCQKKGLIGECDVFKRLKERVGELPDLID